MAGGVHGRGHAWQVVCMAGVVGACMEGEMATAAGSMHPTGMHSCSHSIHFTFYVSIAITLHCSVLMNCCNKSEYQKENSN